METIEQKKRRIIGKTKYLDMYIKTLNKITFKKIDSTMLLSIVDTDKLYPTIKKYRTDKITCLEFRKKSEQWDAIKQLFGDNSLYLWLTHGNECGLCPLESINQFNIEFDYEDDPEGIIVLLTHDFSKKIVFDFFEEDNEKKINIIERSAT